MRTGPGQAGIAKERVRRLAAAARASQQLADTDREARDTAIEEADVADLSVREIATASGISPSRIQAIIVARTAARQHRLRQAAQLDE